MSENTPVPSIAFDPTRHVIAGRDAKTGIPKFFALGDIVAAERAIERETPTETAGGISRDEVTALEQRLLTRIQQVREAAPPVQFPVDMMQTIEALTQTIIFMTGRIQKLEEDNAVFANNFAELKRITGAA